jgi:membrane-bound ClpP family serine protease
MKEIPNAMMMAGLGLLVASLFKVSILAGIGIMLFTIGFIFWKNFKD